MSEEKKVVPLVVYNGDERVVLGDAEVQRGCQGWYYKAVLENTPEARALIGDALDMSFSVVIPSEVPQGPELFASGLMATKEFHVREDPLPKLYRKGLTTEQIANMPTETYVRLMAAFPELPRQPYVIEGEIPDGTVR